MVQTAPPLQRQNTSTTKHYIVQRRLQYLQKKMNTVSNYMLKARIHKSKRRRFGCWSNQNDIILISVHPLLWHLFPKVKIIIHTEKKSAGTMNNTIKIEESRRSREREGKPGGSNRKWKARNRSACNRRRCSACPDQGIVVFPSIFDIQNKTIQDFGNM